ncbi:MAG: family 78 glycoside hydrolase catalytic domain [Clostridia bacterium]|nr:family 78 glycoside hydrolase catalytic domain [Clostridia bacterium]
MVTLTDLTVDYLKNPLGIENRKVRFGWKISGDVGCIMQKNYSIKVATSENHMDSPDLWDSGVIESDISDNIVYEGKKLEPATQYWVKVTVNAGNSEKTETVSGICSFETALSDENFSAKWICQKNFRYSWAQYLRKEFRTDESKKIVRCRAYFSALGCGELYINGSKIGDSIFDPALTNYEKISPYVCYDITENISQGDNAIGILLGDGWYCQRHAWYPWTHYGDCRTLLEIHIVFEDGSIQKILSDESFKCDFSPITTNNVHCGETYDARLEQNGWCNIGFDDSAWTYATETEAPGGTLTSIIIPPIRKVREVKPISVTTRHKGSKDQVFIYDMGENFSGFVKIKIPDSPPAARYVMRFSEEIDPSGELWYASSGAQHTAAIQQDIYIAKGFGKDTEWEPRFTYHGFRYVEVIGVQTYDMPAEDFLTGYAVNTDLKSAGEFTCSNEYINKIHELTRRTFLSNYHGFPEDCPVREKCGWLGDAQLVSETAIYNFYMPNSYEKYLEDIRTTKEIHGTWQMISPGRRTCGEATPLWGCAQIVIPWNMYLYYNDKAVLEKYYGLMCEWVQHELNRSKDYIIDEGLGDWCPPHAEKTEDDPSGERYRIPVKVSSTAEFYRCAYTMVKVAKILKKSSDTEYFAKLAAEIKKAFINAFFDFENNSYGTQGADGVALRYGLYPDGAGEKIAADYIKLLEESGYQMYTGIFANKHSVPSMTEYGYGAEMLKALFSENNNNFRKMIETGATSLYECFVVPHDTVDPASLNHPMQGAFTSWYYSHILGINPSENMPGFREIIFKPYVFDGITSAEGSFESPYGKIVANWNIDSDTKLFTYNIKTPPNTHGTVIIPKVNGFPQSSVKCFDENGCEIPAKIDFPGNIIFSISNGSYHVTAAKQKQ